MCWGLFEAVKTAVPDVDDAREEPAFEIRVELEDICSMDEQMAHSGALARVIEVLEEAGWSVIFTTLWHNDSAVWGLAVGNIVWER